MNLWNVKGLNPPPITTYKTGIDSIDIQTLRQNCNEAYEYFKNNSYLVKETSVLSRIIYRMKLKFRTSKDFKTLEKIEKVLYNYLTLDIAKLLKDFLDLLPRNDKSEDIYLPSKDLLKFILLRFQGAGKLMVRLNETCKASAFYLQKRIFTGHFWKYALILYALVARIFIISKDITKHLCVYYLRMYSFTKRLENPNKKSMFKEYKFPKDLKEWLNVDWIDDKVEIIDLDDELPDIMEYMDLVNEDSDDDVRVVDDDLIFVGVQKNSRPQNIRNFRGFEDDDIGEVIELDDTLKPNQESIIEINDSIDGTVNKKKSKKRNKKRKMPMIEESNEVKKPRLDSVSSDSVQILSKAELKQKKNILFPEYVKPVTQNISSINSNSAKQGKKKKNRKKKKKQGNAQNTLS